ncbi:MULTISPECIES: hypothetical protein [Flavobacterium]|uniref:Uncharacterized protein n=1 Tax=Flavobacterium hankyongi TaxID=1176532 RepID=A0ABP8ZW04_9FLAO|nr:hypothetical protein [Flavobacterium sp. N1846]
MKKIIFLSFLITIPTGINAQNKTISKSIISPTAIIKKFHEKTELDGMQKGDLVNLYIERINVISKKLPFIALTNKRGVTINDVGIPDNTENNKILEKQHQTIKTFISETETFERTLIPFADKSDIIDAILFCENVLKEWRLIGE